MPIELKDEDFLMVSLQGRFSSYSPETAGMFIQDIPDNQKDGILQMFHLLTEPETKQERAGFSGDFYYEVSINGQPILTTKPYEAPPFRVAQLFADLDTARETVFNSYLKEGKTPPSGLNLDSHRTHWATFITGLCLKRKKLQTPSLG